MKFSVYKYFLVLFKKYLKQKNMNNFSRKLRYILGIDQRLLVKIIIFVILLILCANLLLEDYKRLVRKFKKYSHVEYKVNNLIRIQVDYNDYLTSDRFDWADIKNGFDKLIIQNKSEMCAEIPDGIQGRISIENITDNFTAMTSQIDHFNFSKNLELGGKWSPKHCKARHRVAIVVPYKDRQDNLNCFMHHMHSFLQTQELEYQLFVVEQTNDNLFNKGVLMNSAFLEILNLYKYSNKSFQNFPFDCIIYHDVDLLPEGLTF